MVTKSGAAKPAMLATTNAKTELSSTPTGRKVDAACASTMNRIAKPRIRSMWRSRSVIAYP
jgi:hypothetical protein